MSFLMQKNYFQRLFILAILSLFFPLNASAELMLIEGPFVVNAYGIGIAQTQGDHSSTKATEIHQHGLPPSLLNRVPHGETQNDLNRSSDPIEPNVDETTFQTELMTASSPLPAIDFLGHEQSGWIPPDTNGAVSSEFVLTTVNNDYNVKDRMGNLLLRVSLDDFWRATGTTGNSFDTRSRFDPYAQRFIIMSAGALSDAVNSSVLIAVSQTNDPTGAWNLYRAVADQAQQLWLDYPTIGFNRHWIAVHGNMFPISNAGFTTRLWLFPKSALYVGATTSVNVLPGLGVTTQPVETYDADIDELYLLNQADNEGLNLYRITGAVGAEQAEYLARINAPLGWTGGIPGAPQKDTSEVIYPGLNWLMDAVYRNGVLWGTQVVEPLTAPTRTAVQWWKIGTQGDLLDFGRIDDSSGETFYGFPSIAVNADDDALIGYTRFTADSYPSAGYALRKAADPAGTFREGVVYKEGLAPYLISRWGDYSHTQVDPVNDRDFWTVQEIAAENTSWATWWAQVKVDSCTHVYDPLQESGNIFDPQTNTTELWYNMLYIPYDPATVRLCKNSTCQDALSNLVLTPDKCGLPPRWTATFAATAGEVFRYRFRAHNGAQRTFVTRYMAAVDLTNDTDFDFIPDQCEYAAYSLANGSLKLVTKNPQDLTTNPRRIHLCDSYAGDDCTTSTASNDHYYALFYGTGLTTGDTVEMRIKRRGPFQGRLDFGIPLKVDACPPL